MNSQRRRTIPAILILMTTLAALSATTVVLPFKIGKPDQGNHHWLGRAISFYLTTGLSLNSIENIPSPSIQAMLHAHQIAFPYSITKATGIKLALQSRARILLWGDILTAGDAQNEFIEIKSYIIDLSNLTQKYLPLLKFKLDDFYAMQRELLSKVLKYFKVQQPKFPQLDLDYHTYELFIKSLLLTDPQKKLPLLSAAYGLRPGSQLLNLELAKVNLNQGNLTACRTYLTRVADSPFFKIEKDFITALVFIEEGDTERAGAIFEDIASGPRLTAEASNNLGVIAASRGDLQQAKIYLEACRNAPPDDEFFYNTVLIHLLKGESARAEDLLRRFLLIFPDEENLIHLFSYVLSKTQIRDLLIAAFAGHIPNLKTTPDLPGGSLAIKNPFLPQMEEVSRTPREFRRLMLSNQSADTGARIQILEEMAEANPFIPDLHSRLSLLYSDSKKMDRALTASLCAAFLKPTAGNFLQLLKTIRAIPGRPVETGLAREIRRRFPHDKQIQRLLKRLEKRK